MSTQEIKLAKVKKSCKAAKIITRIMTIIAAIATVLCLAGCAIVSVMGDKINEAIMLGQGSFSVTNPEINGLLSFSINLESMVQAGEYAKATIIVCVFGALVCLCLTIISAIINRTFVKLERCETPFAAEVMKSLKAMFIVLTAAVVVCVGLGDGLIIGVCLWCVYTIMDYGCALQEEVDDTV